MLKRAQIVSAQVECMPVLGRYFLHAHRIGFELPSSGEPIAIVSPLPPELEEWLELLRGVPDRTV